METLRKLLDRLGDCSGKTRPEWAAVFADLQRVEMKLASFFVDQATAHLDHQSPSARSSSSLSPQRKCTSVYHSTWIPIHVLSRGLIDHHIVSPSTLKRIIGQCSAEFEEEEEEEEEIKASKELNNGHANNSSKTSILLNCLPTNYLTTRRDSATVSMLSVASVMHGQSRKYSYACKFYAHFLTLLVRGQ